MKTFASRAVRKRMHASWRRTKRLQTLSSSGFSPKSWRNTARKLSFMLRASSRAERRSLQSILTSILEDASAISELRTMWERGTLPTAISTEYAELLEKFNG